MGKETFRDAFYTKAFWDYIVYFLGQRRGVTWNILGLKCLQSVSGFMGMKISRQVGLAFVQLECRLYLGDGVCGYQSELR
jgi:hypothetical protein